MSLDRGFLFKKEGKGEKLLFCTQRPKRGNKQKIQLSPRLSYSCLLCVAKNLILCPPQHYILHEATHIEPSLMSQTDRNVYYFTKQSISKKWLLLKVNIEKTVFGRKSRTCRLTLLRWFGILSSLFGVISDVRDFDEGVAIALVRILGLLVLYLEHSF